MQLYPPFCWFMLNSTLHLTLQSTLPPFNTNINCCISAHSQITFPCDDLIPLLGGGMSVLCHAAWRSLAYDYTAVPSSSKSYGTTNAAFLIMRTSRHNLTCHMAAPAPSQSLSLCLCPFPASCYWSLVLRKREGGDEGGRSDAPALNTTAKFKNERTDVVWCWMVKKVMCGARGRKK